MKISVTVHLLIGAIASFLMTPFSATADSYGGFLGLLLPRPGYIRYADLAPSVSIFYAPSIGGSNNLCLHYDIGMSFFRATNRNLILEGEPYARRLTEYGYSIHAGPQLRFTKLQTYARRLQPQLAIQPGFYLMNTEIEFLHQASPASPQLEHQFIGRFGLKLAGSVGYYSHRRSGPTLNVAFDYIPKFERGESESVFVNKSHPALYWTISIGWIFGRQTAVPSGQNLPTD